MLLLSLSLAFTQTPPPPPKTKPAEAVVTLEDRSITLPPLPRDGAQGRKAFKGIHKQIRQAMEDLTQTLESTYRRPEAGLRLPAALSVPAGLEAEGAELLRIIEDPDYLRLERTYLDTWKGWQAALIEGGLATPSQAPPKTQPPASKTFEAAREKGRQALRSPSRQPRTVERLDAGYKAQDWGDDIPGINMTPLRPEEQVVGSVEFTKKESDIQNRLAMNDRLLPDLSEAWNPLVGLLNERALRVLDQEGAMLPSTDATVNALRVHARLALLERFRKALWYCDLVWCQLADAAPPPPPQRLVGPARSQSVQGEDPAGAAH